VQFIGQFSIDAAVSERLIALHRACDRQGLVKPGAMSKGGAAVVDVTKKDSLDLVVAQVPEPLQDEYGVPDYMGELGRCLDQYKKQHPLLQQIGTYRMTESPIIQHYRPGGGFKLAHFERSGLATTTRMLVWMTFLNDVTDGGGTRFVYQDHTFDALRGRTLIWPSDFTHTHVGVVSPSQHKYIITGWFNFAE